MGNIVHRGKVVDASGRPLYQAHVITINSNPKRGVVTDQNGNFYVEGSLHESFEITHVGFKGQIFRLERYMADKTYQLFEDSFALDEVVVSPRTPVPAKPKFDLGEVFTTIGGIFGNNDQVFNTPVFNPAETKVPTFSFPTVTGNPTPNAPVHGSNVPSHNSMEEQNGWDSFNDWVKNNPLLAGGALLGAILAGTVIFRKNKPKPTKA